MFKLHICEPGWEHWPSTTTGRELYNLARSIAVTENALEEDHYESLSYILISDDSLKDWFNSSKFSGNGWAVVSLQGFSCDKPEVTFKFESIEDADAFKAYMSDGGGEQHFCDVDDETGEEIYYNFEYHDPGGSIVVVKKAK